MLFLEIPDVRSFSARSHRENKDELRICRSWHIKCSNDDYAAMLGLDLQSKHLAREPRRQYPHLVFPFGALILRTFHFSTMADTNQRFLGL